ncbi:MAG: T9SS type A sorting domain-containing protein [Ignavibacteriales bacterium]|nr:T9SS type A sorting domain-containing protein [Ignavibacteriales bacterium]
MSNFQRNGFPKIFATILFMMILCINAESFTVRGKITTTTDTAVQYALIRFVCSDDTSKVFSTFTDTLGEYTIILTSVSEPEPTIQSFTLYQNYPNPFSEQTAIPYSIKENSQVNITIYDILGKKVKSFDQSYQPSGTYSVEWDGTDEEGRKAAYGIYFYRIISKQGTQTKKMIYVNPNDLGQFLFQRNGFPSHDKFESNTAISSRKTSVDTYTVYIENTDSTKPKIESTKIENVIIHGDTVINFQVVEASKWELLGLKEEDIISIAVHPTNDNIIYAGSSYDFSAGHMGKLFKSTDSGETWDTLIVGSPLFSFLDIVIDPFHPETLYTIPLPILKSTNGGETWFEIMSEVNWEKRVSSIAIDPNNSQILYAGIAGFFGGGFIKSTDGGESWRVLSRTDTLREGVISIAIDPNNSNIVYAGTADVGRLWKTTDGGDTWILTGLGTTNSMIDAVAVSPFNSNIVYASVRFMGFFLSNDGGIIWENVQLPDTIMGGTSILFGKLQPGLIILATTKGCLMKRGDNSDWYYLNEGLEGFIYKAFNTVEFYRIENFLLGGRTTFLDIGGIYVRKIY